MNHVHIGAAVSGGGPTAQQYGGTNQPPPHGPGPPNVGGLPFTGLDLGLMFAAGVVLVAFGTALRRRIPN